MYAYRFAQNGELPAGLTTADYLGTVKVGPFFFFRALLIPDWSKGGGFPAQRSHNLLRGVVHAV